MVIGDREGVAGGVGDTGERVIQWFLKILVMLGLKRQPGVI